MQQFRIVKKIITKLVSILNPFNNARFCNAYLRTVCELLLKLVIPTL